MTTHPKATLPAPDGAKPGAETPSPAAYDFDADARAATREGADVTIGGTVYHRVRKNWEVTRAMRALLRVQEKAGARGDRLRAQVDALTEKIRGVRDDGGGWKVPPLTDDDEVAAIEAQVDDLDARIDEASDASDAAAFALIRLLLRDDDGEAPTDDHLKGALDYAEAGDLAANLIGGGEPDPTSTSPSS